MKADFDTCAGGRLIANHTTFQALVAEARLQARKSFAAAATWAEIAALHASSRHSGVFASSEVDAMLLEIGQTLRPVDHFRRNGCGMPARVLHVATWVGPIGGLSRFLWRWIASDPERCHSLAITHQTKGEIPAPLAAAVRACGGSLHLTNWSPGGVLGWAQRLRVLMAEADLIVLHIGTHDVVPILALADKAALPPVVLVNHADHLFWIGRRVVDIVVSSRESGAQLCIQRRGLPPKRNFVLPLLVDRLRNPAKTTRREAKAALGIDADNVVLLSIARGIKYHVRGEANYAEAVLPVLKRHRNAVLVIVGPGDEEDWSNESAEVEGRIIVTGEQSDTALYYQAADIYLDSYPFCSITSLIEAGSHGLPLVSRFPFSKDSAVLGALVPGIAETIRIAETLEDYRTILAELIVDESLRGRIGERTRANVERLHMGEGWRRQLMDLYARTGSVLPQIYEPAPSVDSFNIGDPDRHILRIADWSVGTETIILSRLKILPVRDLAVQVFALARKLGLKQLVGAGLIKSIVPEWVMVKARRVGAAAGIADKDRLPSGISRTVEAPPPC